MIDVFQAYFQQQMLPINVQQAKAELEKIVLNAYPSNPTPMANALLHYCNPDRHIHIFASEINQWQIVGDIFKIIPHITHKVEPLFFQKLYFI